MTVQTSNRMKIEKFTGDFRRADSYLQGMLVKAET